jgi:hypothetical protein
MPVFLPPTVAERPNERLRSWAVFEVLVPGLGERTRHVAGDVADGSGRVSSPLVAIDDTNRSVVTRSGRVYRLIGRPGLGLEGEYVWRNWLSGTEARDITDVTAEFRARFAIAGGDGA